MQQIAIQYNFDGNKTYRIIYNNFDAGDIDNTVFVLQEDMTKDELKTIQKLFEKFSKKKE